MAWAVQKSPGRGSVLPSKEKRGSLPLLVFGEKWRRKSLGAWGEQEET